MFAGHLGAALAIGRAEPKLNVGALVTASLLLDLVLWVFVLLGWETVIIPANFASTHQAAYTFPYSHGLVAGLIWSGVAGLATLLWLNGRAIQRRAALLVALTVFSHWVLDALVHRPELPLAGTGSLAIGLGLWNRMPVAIGLEVAIVLAGLWLFLGRTPLTRGKAIAVTVLTLVILAFTVIGMTLGPAPPSARAMAASSLGTLALVCALAAWLGRVRAPSPGA